MEVTRRGSPAREHHKEACILTINRAVPLSSTISGPMAARGCLRQKCLRRGSDSRGSTPLLTPPWLQES
jgi:hypothetical protein